MDDHIRIFFSEYSDLLPEGNFHRVVALHDSADVDWKTLSKMVPTLPKGWYELSRLSPKDRIQFSLDFWLSNLPYHPKIDHLLSIFFGNLDDIALYITQQEHEDPFEAHLVYSLSGNRGFYRGAIPAEENQILNLKRVFRRYILPEDYLAFLQIHNGFWKTTDTTGIICSKDLLRSYDELQKIIEGQGAITTESGKIVDPKTLIPFYESFGMPFYQCFWAEWYPEQEMGNVYYCIDVNKIPDPVSNPRPENLTFPTFTDWLIFYLEQIEA